MTFHDLPENWPDLPLTEPRLVADVLDLVVTDASRSSGALYLLMCDSQHRLVQPCAIDDVPTDCDDSDRQRVLSAFVSAVGGLDGSVLIALARPGELESTSADGRWLDIARQICDSSDVHLLGFHVVTPAGSRQLAAA